MKRSCRLVRKKYFHFVDKMPTETVQKGTSTLTLLFVAIAGGIIAVSLQPVILILYSHLGIPTAPLSYQQPSNEIIYEKVPTTTTIVTTQRVETTTAITTRKIETTTVTTTEKPALVKNDPTVDEEPIILRDEPLTIKIPELTTAKPVVTEKPKKSSDTKKVPKSEEASQPVNLKKANAQPEIVDVTGRNKQIPDEVKNFKSTKISTFTHN